MTTDLQAARDDIQAFSQLIGVPLTDWQAAAARLEPRTSVIVAPRQTGKSRTLSVIALHGAFRTPRTRVLIVSAGEEAARSPAAQTAEPFQTPEHMEGAELSARDLAFVEAIAFRVAGLLDGRSTAEPSGQLVGSAELALALGVSRGFVYEHADELGAIRIGDGPKPRLRFDLERARSAGVCSTGGRSQAQNASDDGGSAGSGRRGRRRLPNGLPKPGSVLRVRGEEAA